MSNKVSARSPRIDTSIPSHRISNPLPSSRPETPVPYRQQRDLMRTGPPARNKKNNEKMGSGKHNAREPMFGMFGGPKDMSEKAAWQGHFVAMSGEFVGTFMFLFMAFLGHSMSVQQAPDFGPGHTNSNQTVIFISMSYGLSLLVTAWTMYRISGGLFNPAVTLGMVITGTLPPIRGLCLFPAQILGAIAGAGVASGIIPGKISVVQTTLTSNMSTAQGLFLEMFLTSYLIFTILMLAGEKSKDTFLAPIGIGLSLFVAEIAGVYYTGASLNPARSFAPCVVAGSFQTYHWIYWIGPFLGALISGGYYHFVKFFNYETANPGQDSAGADEEEMAGGSPQPMRTRSGENGRL